MDYRVADAVRGATGLETVLLEQLGLTSLVVELIGPTKPVSGYRWVVRDEYPSLGDRYADWLTRTASRTLDQRPPWFRPGWYQRARDYLAQVMQERGVVRRGPVEQVKQWSMSSVLRVDSSGGRLFLKAVVPELAHEPTVVRWLVDRWPAMAPTVVAADQQQGWWVTTDLGDLTAATLEPRARSACLDQLARLQTRLAGTCDDLVDLGCAPLGSEQLAAQVVELLAREQLWRAAPSWRNRNRALTTAEQRRLQATETSLLERCAKLGKLPMADSLIHGDYQPTNVVLRSRGYGILDWSFAAVGCPLLDLAAWLDGAGEQVAAYDVRRYLKHWAPCLPAVEAWSWWQVAKPLAAVVELKKFADLATSAGGAYDFTWLAMTYSWARRLINATEDHEVRIPGWRT
jgi:hypothetical protein